MASACPWGGKGLAEKLGVGLHEVFSDLKKKVHRSGLGLRKYSSSPKPRRSNSSCKYEKPRASLEAWKETSKRSGKDRETREGNQ